MKILIVNKFLYPNGGSETYIFKLGEELVRQGHEVQYFGMEHAGRTVGNRAERYTSDMDFHAGGLSKLTYPFKILYSREAAKKLTAVLEDFEPDIVHLNNFNFQLTPSVITATRKWEKRTGHRVKIVYTAHDYQLICPNHMLRRPFPGGNCTDCIEKGCGSCIRGRCIHGSRLRSLLGAFEGGLYRFLHTYRQIDLIVCPTEFMKQKLDRHPDLAGRTVVLRNFSTIDPEERSVSKKEKPLSGEYVLYFGRYAEEKGIGTLLHAIRELSEIPFVFAGKGPQKEEVTSIKNVRDLGFLAQDELKPVIENAAFSLYPSEWYENCPFSVMESIQYGTPVLGARIGGIPELICDGENGELFESGNEAELRAKIEELWSDKEKCAAYSRNAWNTHFMTPGEYVKKLLLLYAGVAQT